MTNEQGRRPTGPGWYWYTGEFAPYPENREYSTTIDQPVEVLTANNALVWRYEPTPVRYMPGDFTPIAKPVAAPEPDWSGYPHGDCFIMDPYGDAVFYFDESDVTWDEKNVLPYMSDVDAVFTSRVELPPHRYDGVDWRTTLRRRPEAAE